MKYEIVPSNQFRKDLKLAQKRGYDLDTLVLDETAFMELPEIT